MQKPEIIIKAKDIKKAVASLPKTGPFGEEIAKNKNQSIIVSRNITSKGASPKAELHENHNDIFIVMSGKEELFIGGKITDKKEIKPGEWRGEKLKDSRKYKIGAGDIVIIPAGISHRHGKGTIKLMVIKTGAHS